MKIFFLVVMIIGNLGDAISTYFCAKKIGTQGETNPIIQKLLEGLGIIPTIALKLLVFSILGILIYPKSYSWMNLLIGSMYILATGKNLYALRKETQ